MAKKKCNSLVVGLPLSGVETSSYRIEVCPGRWNPPSSDDDPEFAVIVQERKYSLYKSAGVFKMAIPPEAVGPVVEGLLRWLELSDADELSSLFPSWSHPVTAGSDKACGSGPCRPSPQLIERSELGAGRQGEPQDQPADGFPEV